MPTNDGHYCIKRILQACCMVGLGLIDVLDTLIGNVPRPISQLAPRDRWLASDLSQSKMFGQSTLKP